MGVLHRDKNISQEGEESGFSCVLCNVCTLTVESCDNVALISRSKETRFACPTNYAYRRVLFSSPMPSSNWWRLTKKKGKVKLLTLPLDKPRHLTPDIATRWR